MQVDGLVTNAWDIVSDKSASLLSKADAYLTLLSHVKGIEITEHKDVQLDSFLPNDTKFLQSLCTRLSRLFHQDNCSCERGGCTGSSESDEGDEGLTPLQQAWKEFDGPIEDFMNSLEEEESYETNSSTRGIGGNNVATITESFRYKAEPWSKLEEFLSGLIAIKQVESKRNYKKFLPLVWKNPLKPFVLNKRDEVKRPCIAYYESGQCNHEKLISGLNALDRSKHLVFKGNEDYLRTGVCNGKHTKLSDVDASEFIVFTHGCSCSTLTQTLTQLKEMGKKVTVYTLFSNPKGYTCGCDTFREIMKHDIEVKTFS